MEHSDLSSDYNPGLTPQHLAETFQQSLESTREFASPGTDVSTVIETDNGPVTIPRDEFESVEPDEQPGRFVLRLAKGAGEHKTAVITVSGAALLAGAAAWVYRHKKR